MNDPICAVCGETKVSELRMYNYGVCLCHRCNETAAHAFIKMHTEKKLKKEGEREDLRRCAICGKDVPFIHPGELVINVDGKVVCPVCEKKVAKLHEKAEEHRKGIGHTRKEETAKEYIERVDREQREKEFEELIERLYLERKEKEREAEKGLCPDCLKKYKLEKAEAEAEEAAQLRMADLQIENNRLRTGLKDLKEEYESFRERTSRVWWGVAVAGVMIGSLFTLMFLNPK